MSSSITLNWINYNGGAGYDGVLGLGPVTENYWQSASLINKLSRDFYID